MSELDIEVAQRRSPELIDLCIDSAEENEVENIGANEGQNSAEITSDLEEGEIREPKNEVCRYFRRGRCWLGKHCNFLHIGTNPYKMFDSPISPQFNTRNFQPVLVYQPIIIDQSTLGPPDAWDRGLNEARKLLLNAKLKKESDLDFEEKQLYQGLDEIMNDKKGLYMSSKLEKREKTRSNSRLETSNRRSDARQTIAKERSSVRQHGKVTLKRKRRSNSVSPIQFHRRQNHSPDSSSFSSCAKCKALCKSGHNSKKDTRKTKSKLERAFSRTFGSPETLRSGGGTSRCFNLCRRSLSKHSSIKRTLYQPYSNSPSLKNKYLKNRAEKYPPRKPLHKNSILPMPEKRTKFGSSHSKKERSGSPLKLRSRNCAYDLECYSSDMTVSSITCTFVSTSCTSYEEKTYVQPVMVSRRILNGEHAREHNNSRDINKWLDTVPTVTTKGSESKSETTKKIIDKKKKKNTKSVEKDKTEPKLNRKLSSSSSTADEELSAGELELLRYIPNKKRQKVEQKKKATNPKTPVKQLPPQKDCGTNEENLSTETIVRYPPPKIVYDYGSDTEDVSLKLIRDYESDKHSSSQLSAESKNEDPTPKTSVENLSPKNLLDHETNGGNQFPKESNGEGRVDDSSEKSESVMQAKCPSTEETADADIPKQLDEHRVEHKNDSPSTNKTKPRRRSSSDSSVERPLSKDQLELLKYVSFSNSGVSKKIKKQTKKNPPVSNDKKAKQKTVSNSDDTKNSSKVESAGQKKVKTSKLSRREQLIQQLKDVELIIAERKKQAKLAYAKLSRKRLSEK